jgi:hypothetical protein
MAQKRRGAKEGQPKLERITLMIPAELKAELDSEVEAGAWTFSDAVRQRLVGNVQRSAWADVERQFANDARAFGRLTAFLTNELSPTSAERASELRAAIGYLIDRIYGTPKAGSPVGQAEMMAELWWLRMNNAQERTYEDGAPVPMTVEQRALAEIRSDMAVGQTAAEHPRMRHEKA